MEQISSHRHIKHWLFARADIMTYFVHCMLFHARAVTVLPSVDGGFAVSQKSVRFTSPCILPFSGPARTSDALLYFACMFNSKK